MIRHVPPAWNLPKSLVRPLDVVVGKKLCQEMPQVPLAENDEMIQALLTQSLRETFAISIQVVRSRPNPDDCCVLGLEDRVEFFGVFRVVINHEIRRWQTQILHLHRRVSSLLAHPGCIRVCADAGDKHLPGAGMNEEQNGQIDQSLGCSGFYAQKVADSQRGGMMLEELVPGADTAFRS